jgi:hypothetical protein
MNLYYFRKMFATYLRNNGIEAESLIKWVDGEVFESLCPYVLIISVDRLWINIDGVTLNKMRPVIDSWYMELTWTY